LPVELEPPTPVIVSETPVVLTVPAPPGVVTAAPRGLDVIPLQVGYGVRGPFYEIYFTDPFNPAAWREEGGPDTALAAAIDGARLSVDVAAYSFSLYSIQQALIHASDRGVQVRMVMESDNMNGPVVNALLEAGIPIVGDQREGLMHDKFVVIDRSEVWTGSMNFTTSGAYADNNNLLRIRSSKFANDYTVEFEEMFKLDFFGPDVLAKTPNPSMLIEDMPVEVYFSPDDHVAQRIVQLMRNARKSIYFMAYSFTADDFGDIVKQKARDGLTVEGVMEEKQALGTGSEFAGFTEAALPVYLDGNKGQMHHKVIIIDGEIVITGSYNFTASAERTNDENVVIFHDTQIATEYLVEFERVFTASQK
jgi:phosphatidylserine/phosphatidylglycerophosphate/cardiolipin synthase-like enzyme